MRILHIVDTGGIYGKEQVVLSLIKEQEKEHTVYLYSTGKSDLARTAHNNGATAVCYYSTWDLIVTVMKNQSQFDLIHVHGYKESILFSMQRFLGLLKIPMIKTVHGYCSKGKPLFSRIRLYELLDRLTYPLHDAVVGVSPEMHTDFLVKNGVEDTPPNRETLPGHFKRNRATNNFIIGCSARLSKEKNVEGMIRAMAILSRNRDLLKFPAYGKDVGIKLYLFGDGKEMPKLEELVQKQEMVPGSGKPDEIYLMGYVPNVRDYLGLFDVYVQPSLTEGTPIAVLEAMAAGQFTITSYVGGMKRFVDKGATMACGTKPEDIAFSIIDGFGAKKEMFIKRARDLFTAEYSSKVMNEKYFELYERVLSGTYPRGYYKK